MSDHLRNLAHAGIYFMATVLYIILSFQFIAYAATFSPVAAVLTATWQVLFYGLAVNLIYRIGAEDQ